MYGALNLTSDFSHLEAMSVDDRISFFGTTNEWVSRLISVLPTKGTTKKQQKTEQTVQ